MKILLATDGSSCAQEAAWLLSHLPHSGKIDLTVLTVVHLPPVRFSQPTKSWMAVCVGKERALATERGNDGPYFNGDKLCLVDAAYGPIFQRFALVEKVLETGLLKEFPLVQAWSDALLANETITGAVPDNFPEEFEGNHKRRETYYWSRRQSSQVAAE